jgi:uncharacterized membrane protein YwaF
MEIFFFFFFFDTHFYVFIISAFVLVLYVYSTGWGESGVVVLPMVMRVIGVVFIFWDA